jgi:hypothetical protein
MDERRVDNRQKENGFIDSDFAGPGTLIIAVPEPETYLTGVILLLGGTIYLFRRAKHREGHRPAWPKFLARKAFQERIEAKRGKTVLGGPKGEHSESIYRISG